jgi:hypothetical protein
MVTTQVDRRPKAEGYKNRGIAPFTYFERSKYINLL